MLPWLEPARSVAELQWAKAQAACAIFKRGFDLGRRVDDRHFLSVYEAADAIEMPLCIHPGHPGSDPGVARGVPIMLAFTALACCTTVPRTIWWSAPTTPIDDNPARFYGI